MFDSNLDFKLVQVRKNKYPVSETYEREFIFRFYRHTTKCCIKYVASVKSYERGLLTLDYYPKISLTPKRSSLDNVQDLRYQMLTKQNAFGSIGGTIMEIMLYIRTHFGMDIWGFLAANLGNRKNSAIFVIPARNEKEMRGIIKRYESIFTETN